MAASIEIITTPTSDSLGTTLMLRTGTKHYFFGSLAEGTQRATVQQGAKLIKAQDYFITGRSEWSNIGGMMGMMLTLAGCSLDSSQSSAASRTKPAPDPPKPHFNIYGPPNLKQTIAACRRFIFRKGVPIHATEFLPEDQLQQRDENSTILPTWQDSNIQVWALTIKPLGRVHDAQADAELEAQQEHYDSHLNDFEDHKAPAKETPEARQARYSSIRSATLKYMFDSDWSFDTLVEQHISKIVMPAAIFVRDPRTDGYKPYIGPMPGSTQTLPNINVFTRTPWPGANVANLPPTRPISDCVSYIVRTHGSRGAFDVARAIALGVKQGPDFGKLALGQSVQNQDGQWIKPDQVLGAERLGQGFAILDIPTVEYVQGIIEREELKSSQILSGIRVFIWLLGPGVLGHPYLSQFWSNMPQVQHIISSLNLSPNRITFDSVAAQTTRLGQIDPTRYSTPIHSNLEVPQKCLHNVDSTGPLTLPEGLKAADRGMSFILMPKFEAKVTTSALFNPDKIRHETQADVLNMARKARASVEDNHSAMTSWKKLIARPETEVITLGTGSAMPSKYRNVSSTLVRVPGVGNYLFDAGENTIGQLTRMFPLEELVDTLRHLRMIWISHLHADHHLGTASIIRSWYHIVHGGVPKTPPFHDFSRADNSPASLAVISHSGMLQWLYEYSSVEDFGYSRILPLQLSPHGQGRPSELSMLNFSGKFASPDLVISKKDYEKLFGFHDIQAVRVSHCVGAMAICITFPSSPSDGQDGKPLKVSYSGDCRPSYDFSKIGQDTTVLIHEATFDDELSGDARAKKHSTTSEALSVGAEMNAKSVILTHFSQRYQKIPVLQNTTIGKQEDSVFYVANKAEKATDVDVEHLEDTIEDPGNVDIFPSITASEPILCGNKKIVKIKNKDMKVAVAFDYMRVRIGEIIEVEKFNDALNLLLLKEEKEGETIDDGRTNGNGKKLSGDQATGQGRKQKKAKSTRNN